MQWRPADVVRARPTPPKPWTFEEFLAWEREQEERHEFVDGVIRLMVGGTLDRNTIAGNVFAGLRSHLRGGPWRVFVEAVKVVSDAAIMYPDVVRDLCARIGPERRRAGA